MKPNVSLASLLTDLLEQERPVKFAYLFGSQVYGNAGRLSDVDVAVYVDDSFLGLEYRLALIERIVRCVHNDRVDVVVLNDAPPTLTHEIIKTGKILKDDKPERVIFEIKALAEYLDTGYLRDTQFAEARKRIRQGTYFG